MKIGQSTPQSPTQGRTEGGFEVKKGDAFSATIKERLPNNEAKLQIRGKEVTVKFEGNIPKNDQVTIQFTDVNSEIPQVKALTDGANGPSESDVSKFLKDLGTMATPELKTAIRNLLNQGYPLTKESIAELKAFLEEKPGGITQKLETIKVIASKGLEMTGTHLRAVHAALHGKPLGDQLTDLADSLGLELGSNSSGGNTGVKLEPEQVRLPTRAESKSVHELIKQALEFVRRELNVSKAIHWIQEQLVNNPNLEEGIVVRVEGALKQAEHLQQQGREMVARSQILQVLEQVQNDTAGLTLNVDKELIGRESIVDKVIQHNQAPQNKQQLSLPTNRDGVPDQIKQPDFAEDPSLKDINVPYELSEELLAGIKSDSKDIVVTHVTERMAQAAVQFKEFKREVTRNLDYIARIANEIKVNVYPQIQQRLEVTIDLIDKAILKSDFVMFADMVTEKQLMAVSMDLATAKKHLANGQNEQAATLLEKVKTQLQELNWKPADVKIRHVLENDHILRQSHSPQQEIKHYLGHISGLENQGGSARGTFDLIRSFGLNYDSEIAQSLVLSQDRGNEEQIQKNMKAAMMKLVGNEADPTLKNQGADPQVREILQNVTGQQLLNKMETGSPLQTMFFSLPLMMGAKMETVKLYVNAKKDGQKIDWENCSLYFLLDTKKLGETGILLTANNRNLSITIKNNHKAFKEKMETIVDKCKDNLQEIGYSIAGIHFTKLSNETELPVKTVKTNDPPAPKRTRATKGFDFSV